jgi:pilus assembly protein Flp/PilA
MFIEQLLTYARAHLRREEGQALTEYALILVLISVAAVAIMGTVGTDIKDAFQSVVDELN